MRRILNLSDEAYMALRSHADVNYRSTAVRLLDGSWNVPFARITVALLDEARHPGESYSDCVLRVAKTASGFQS